VEAPVGVLALAATGELKTPTLPALDPPAVAVPVALAELVELDDVARLPEPAPWLAAVF